MNEINAKNIGLRGVTVADSKISLVDGQNGRLIYRGYAIEDLAIKACFEEIVFLLLMGRLPEPAELADIRDQVAEAREIPAGVMAALRARPAEADPMDVLQGAVSALADYDPDLKKEDRESRVRSSIRLISRIGLVVAAFFHLRNGREPIEVDKSEQISLASSFLRALGNANPSSDEIKLVDTLLILHAEHTFNASTFAVREVASTRAHLYASVCAGVGALSGSLHGGANTRVMQMLEQIGDRANIEPWVKKRIESGQRIMGLGHAVYKTKDPRAQILFDIADKVLAGTEEEKWFVLSKELENTARKSIKELKGLDLYPNVDFYSGGVLRGLGLPMDFFPAFFAVARTAGWCAHFIEEEFAEAQPKPALYRPRANYVGKFCGPRGCDFVPIESRGGGCPSAQDYPGCCEADSIKRIDELT